MWMLILACAISDPGPASSGSQSELTAARVQSIADKAGAVANAARELEEMSDPARSGVAAGEDPQEHIRKMRATMGKIEALDKALQRELEDMEASLVPEAQRTVVTTE
jgi:hypothetical protein